jgi:tetraacyldisaccharide 4'-kinase
MSRLSRLARALTAPLGWPLGCAAAFRRRLYRNGWIRADELRGPVISVGNLSVGGSGKTPIVAHLARMLRREGYPVAVLSRGYRGAFKGEALLVSEGADVLCSAREAGDEPLALARALPGVTVAVGRRRDVVGHFVEQRRGALVHILDDGFQHVRLARTIDVVCVEPEDIDGRPLPAGRLREFVSALGLADVLLLAAVDSDPVFQRLVQRFGRERVFCWRRVPDGFFDLQGQSVRAPQRPFLLAGIARPNRFAVDVRAMVSELVGTTFFRDHHSFSPAELERVAVEARERGADAIVITTKDAARLSWTGPCDPPFRVFAIRPQLEAEERLRELLLARLPAKESL